ncbi:hypothetical protein DB30_05055 [Enhygromyxa salina]|uniref:Uncharacterized protein n=1 Tax=Enhygromyxa salina TaxID=215803 RepID=A0A0C2CYD6_9BACT|nr:hypothetical protein DB30_05055 [Enhygromyxa salina]
MVESLVGRLASASQPGRVRSTTGGGRNSTWSTCSITAARAVLPVVERL